MERQPFNTLVDTTLKYLEQIQEETPYVLSSFLPPPVIKKTPPVEETTSDIPVISPILLERAPQECVPKAPVSPSQAVQVPSASSSPALREEHKEPRPSASRSPVLFTLHPQKPLHPDPMQDLRALVAKSAPSLKLYDTVPSDKEAKKIKSAWKEQANVPDIAILGSPHSSLPFLYQVAKAIELHFFSSRVIEVQHLEESNNWEAFLNTANLKIVITPDAVLWSCKQLMQYYHEFPNKKQRFLGKIPLLLLPDPSLYLKDPSLKRSLWNLLCQILQPLSR